MTVLSSHSQLSLSSGFGRKSCWDYFETTIRPSLDHPLIEFLGEADESRKRELLGNALALLFPIDWPEPFGLVMIESLACGTPVIARRRGSVPEVLEHGQTGFIGETEKDMVAAVHQVATLDRATCRKAFEARFTATGMAQNYLQVYQRLVTLAGTGKRAEVLPLRQRWPRPARVG